MAEKNNATCAICGKGYHLCLSCKDMISLTPWKKHTDTSEHYKIYQVIHGYSTGVYTKEEAKSRLEAIDLSDFDELRDNIKATIIDIKSAGEVAKPRARKKKIPEVVEEVQVDETAVDELI